jgi:hypothetical protein
MAKNGTRHRERGEAATDINVDPATQRQLIEERAYAIFCERGRTLGHDVEDWLAAEQEILAATKATVAQ